MMSFNCGVEEPVTQNESLLEVTALGTCLWRTQIDGINRYVFAWRGNKSLEDKAFGSILRATMTQLDCSPIWALFWRDDEYDAAAPARLRAQHWEVHLSGGVGLAWRLARASELDSATPRGLLPKSVRSLLLCGKEPLPPALFQSESTLTSAVDRDAAFSADDYRVVCAHSAGMVFRVGRPGDPPALVFVTSATIRPESVVPRGSQCTVYKGREAYRALLSGPDFGQDCRS
jgi:hypothetical protein